MMIKEVLKVITNNLLKRISKPISKICKIKKKKKKKKKKIKLQFS